MCGAEIFLRQYTCRSGDYTKEKYERPDLMPEEFAAMADEAKAEAVAAGVWEGESSPDTPTIDELFDRFPIDTTGYVFDRNEANNYD